MPKWRSPLQSPTANSHERGAGEMRSSCHDVIKQPVAVVATSSPSANDRPTSSAAAVTSNNGTAHDDAVVVVPFTGLYGICFGHPDGPFETSARDAVASANNEASSSPCIKSNGVTNTNTGSNNDSDKEPSRRGRRGKKRNLSETRPSHASYCGCVCRADFEFRTSDGGDEAETACLSLPLPAGVEAVETLATTSDESSSLNEEGVPSHHGSSESTVLTSTMIGRIVRLPADTRVRVRATHASSCCRPNTSGNDDGTTMRVNGASSDGTSLITSSTRCPLKWCLVLHREDTEDGSMEGEQHPSYSTAVLHNHRTRIDFNPSDVGGKIFVCSECGRRFPTTTSVRNHVLSVHVAKEGSSSGGGGISSAVAVVGPPILRRPLEVAYSDDVMAVVVKPQGISVMGDRWTLAKSDLLLPLRASPDAERPLTKPKPVHRLDSPTGGLLVVAKTKPIEVELKKCFASRACRKRYRAIVFGQLKHSGTCDIPIDGKPSVTRYEVVSHTRCSDPLANGWMTTVDLIPVTGRKHQLRKHMKALGHPIWGDRIYGPYYKPQQDGKVGGGDEVMLSATDDSGGLLDSATAFKHPHIKLCLWALEIAFPHPTSGEETTIRIDEPRWYKELRDSQEHKTRTK